MATKKSEIDSNLTKEMQNSYTENYKRLYKEMKENLNEWKNISCSWVGILNVRMISIFLKFIYKFNTIPVQILADFYPEMEIHMGMIKSTCILMSTE